MGLLWQCSTQKVVDWQGWTSSAYPKDWASWKKSNGSTIHFEFLNCNQTLDADLYS